MLKKKKITKEAIIIKAIKNKEFYKALKKNPKKILEKEFRQKLPKDLKVKIIDQKQNELHIVIPKILKIEKLSEKELKKITGGFVYIDQFGHKWECYEYSKFKESI